MGNVERFDRKINHNMYCEVDTSKANCNQEGTHCHIVKGYDRTTQIFLDTMQIKNGGNLDRSEIKEALDFVRQNERDIRSAYENNRLYGAD